METLGSEIIERDLQNCPDFGYFGDRPLFDTWAMWRGYAIHRDSEILSQSNWEQILKRLHEVGMENEDWEVLGCGHWAVGHIDHIIYNSECEAVANLLAQIEDELDSYPILDESHYSDMQMEAIWKYWAEMSLRERIDYCKEAEVSIFASRRDNDIPEEVESRLSEQIV